MPSLASLRNRFSVLGDDGYSSDEENDVGVALSMHAPGRAATVIEVSITAKWVSICRLTKLSGQPDAISTAGGPISATGSEQGSPSASVNMDLDEDLAESSPPFLHPNLSFADVVAGTTASTPLQTTPAGYDTMEDQVGRSPEAWKPIPRSLRFRKVAAAGLEPMQASPSAGDKRPFNYVDNLPKGRASSKRANTPAGPVYADDVRASPTPSAPPSSPPSVRTPRAAQRVGIPHTVVSTEQGDMTIDYAPPTASFPPPTTYSPPDAARVLQPPEGGFPIVFGLEQGLLSFVHNNSISLWKQREGDSALVYIANDGLATDTVSRIKAIDTFFSTVFPDFPAPEVGPPEFFKKNDKKVLFKPVMPFCISGSRDLIAALKTRKCWPTPSVTLFVTSLEPDITDFAICLSGFPLDRSETSDLIVTRAARDAVRNDVHLCAFIMNNHDNLSRVEPDHFINFVVGSIVIRSHAVVENDVSITVFNLYITPPTLIPDRMKEWIQGLKRLRYACFRGTGVSRQVFYCDLCKGRDHPTTICPFVAIPGWPANPPFTVDAAANGAIASTLNNARGGFNGRGGRGGNRGRRGRGAF